MFEFDVARTLSMILCVYPLEELGYSTAQAQSSLQLFCGCVFRSSGTAQARRISSGRNYVKGAHVFYI